jgi:hypothetical protein
VSVTGTVAVTQSTSPWIVKDNADGSVAGGAAGTFSMLAGGIFNTVLPTLTNGQQASLQLTTNGALEVQLMNTLPISVTPSAGSTFIVDGNLTNNNAAPAATNVGVLPALAEAAINAARYTTGNQVLPVVDLAGNTNVDVQFYLGAAVSKTNPIATTITDGTNVITAAISAYGTAPTGTEVMGVNAFITNTAAVQGTLTNNNAAPSTHNLGVLPAVAEGALNAALYTTGDQVLLVTDLAGNTNVDLQYVAGTAAVTGGVAGLLAVGGNVAAGTGDSGNGVKVSGVFNTTVPTLTNGQRGDVQVDSRSAQMTTPLDGSRTTYACALQFTAANTATDIMTISGSATKTIRVIRVWISGIQTTAGIATYFMFKRSAANTGGTQTGGIVLVPHDSNSPAATATVAAYTANPTTLGATVGALAIFKSTLATAATTTNIAPVIIDYGNRPSQAPILRGAAQLFAINLGAVTYAGNVLDINIEWTEE